MIILDATTKTIQVLLGGAATTTELPIVASYVDVTTSAYTPGSSDTITTGSTAVTAVSAPVVFTQRQVKMMTVFNADTVDAIVTVRYNNDGTTRILIKATLDPGSLLVYTDGEGWRVLDSNGQTLQAATTTAHASNHENGGTDEINVAGLSGLLADDQNPTAHASDHQSGGGDAIKLDDLAAPDDNSDLNASTSAHGLSPKATAPASGLRNVLAIDNAETAHSDKALFDATNPAALGTAAAGTAMAAARRDHVHTLPKLDDLATPDDNTDLNASATVHGLLPKLSNVATEFLNGQGGWTTPPAGVTGNDTEVQFNDGGSIGADPGMVYNKTTNRLTVDLLSLLGGQVAFPSSQNASSDANTLDDYEEGEWTPGISFGGATTGITYASQSAIYVKFGKFVYVSGFVVLSSNGSASGAAAMTGLPFANGDGAFRNVPIQARSGMASISGAVQGEVDGSATTVSLVQQGATATAALTEANFTDDAVVAINGWYRAAD
jgi:hypothetical protein